MTVQKSPSALDVSGTRALGGVRVAIVHEWLSAAAGSERTFEAMARLIPTADLFALSHNPDAHLDFGGRSIYLSHLNRVTQHGGRPIALPLMPAAWRALSRGQRYDLVITSSHALSRAFAYRMDALHLSYTYTPARYLWLPDLESERSRIRVPRQARKWLRDLDVRYAARVTEFAAISTEVQSRIRRFYRRDSVVVAPPCDTDFFSIDPAQDRERLLMAVSRLVPYKRLDIAIQAAAAVGEDLLIIGEGPDRARLQSIADNLHAGRVTFAGAVDRPQLRDAYRRAGAVIFPAFEDFGIVPVEAQACGAPVVAYRAGGSLDTVMPHEYAFTSEQTGAAFARAVRMTLAEPPPPSACRLHAESFSHARFAERFMSWVTHAVAMYL